MQPPPSSEENLKAGHLLAKKRFSAIFRDFPRFSAAFKAFRSLSMGFTVELLAGRAQALLGGGLGVGGVAAPLSMSAC